MPSVLVVDDDADIALALRMLLERAGYEVRVAGNGREALREFFREPADVVLLDVSMPVMDGWTTLERIREVSEVPVLMLTASGLVHERVRGLQAGADDYQTKPFSNEELLARVAALHRRAAAAAVVEEQTTYADEQVEMDMRDWHVSVGGESVELTPLEFRLLRAFVSHPNHVLSHHQLLELAWGDAGAAESGAVKTYVRYLRKKLGWSSHDSGPIEAVRGVGYRYRPAPRRRAA
jgi:DNA-binding response OmpR family regulator